QYLAPLLPAPDLRFDWPILHWALIVFAVLVAVAGLVAAGVLYGNGGRRAEAIENRFARLYRVLAGKYYVDEVYERLLQRPWRWISDRVFLRLGDRILLDGSLHGLAALARRGAEVLARVQTGSLHWYAWMTLLGLVAVLIWMWRYV
ncbi:MAG: NADH-quinone oxidoreductase subunit L, partial [Thioalkalivibrio sp.]|nr:NADH-quinone oxidoreductase subunit L [Thioalkalivibrio sp.]